MKTLVVGTGGREHALALALSRDPAVTEVHAAPGNPGIGEVATLHDVDPMDGAAVAALATSIGADLVVVGPEAPLVAGVADAVRDAGIAVFGPSRDAARLEGSKAFAKEVMATAGVPTAGSRTCTTADEVAAALDAFGAPHVVKDDALAAGKGVVVTNDRDEALAHAAGCERVVVEEFLDGPEFSLFVVCDGTTGRPLLPAQDFKRIFDGGRGPNTGGMGSYAPLAWLPDGTVETVMAQVVDPTLAEMRRLGRAVRRLPLRRPRADRDGPEGHRVQRALRRPRHPARARAARLPARRAARRRRPTATCRRCPSPTFADGAAVSVVMASAGYPEGSRTGDVVVGTETLAVETDVDVIHAGTARTDAGLVTAGGRVLAVRATGTDVADARAKAYEGISSHQLPGRPVAPRHRRRAARRRRGSGVAWLSRLRAGLATS